MYAQDTKGQDREAEVSRHFTAGQRAQSAGDYATAVREFQSVVVLAPQVAEGYASLGLAYNAEGKFSESAQALWKAQKLKPSLAGVSLYLGIDLVKMRQPSDAIAPLREALDREPENKQPRLWLAAALDESGQLGSEIDELKRAEQHFHADPEILFRLGEIYRRQAESETRQLIMRASGQPLVHQIYGDIYQDEQIWAKAAGHYRSAAALDSRWAGAHLGLGQVALRQGNLEEARAEFEKELTVSPRSASAKAELAAVALMQGNVPGALLQLNSALRISAAESAYALGLPYVSALATSAEPDPAEGQLRIARADLVRTDPGAARALALAFVDFRLGDTAGTEGAWKEFEQHVQLVQPSGLLERGREDFYLGKLDSAADELHLWLKSNPADFTAAYLLVRTERALSLSLLEQLVSVAPDSIPAHELMAETEENAENYKKAAEEYRWVERQSPELPGIHYALGRMLLKTGDREGATAEFVAELHLDPDQPGANAELGSLLADQDKAQESISHLEKALRFDPELWQAHRELGKELLLQKDYAKAEVELKKAVVDDPEGLAYYQLGVLYRKRGQMDLAKKMFSRSQQLKADRLAEQNGVHIKSGAESDAKSEVLQP
jgi:tetratricopeptide (TPR) repeat protein